MVDGLWLASETSLAAVLTHCDELEPEIVIVDSIQTMFDLHPAVGAGVGRAGAPLRAPARQ